MTTSQSRWNFSPDATSALLMAEAHARELRHSEVGTVHILAGIVCEQTGAGGKILRKAGLTVELVNGALGAAQGLGPIQTAKLPYDSEAERLLEMASDTAVADPDTFSSAINTAHLVAAMLNSLCRGREVLFRLAGTRLGEIQAGIAGELPYIPQPILAAAGKQPSPQRNMAKGTQNNQALPDYLSDLTADAEAGRLDPVVGRDDEIKRLIQILCRRTKNNPVLIGEPGVGKTAIAEGLARRIVAGDVPEELRGRRVLGLSIGGLIGGSMYRGEFEQRIKGLLKMLEDKSSILLIDEVHTLVGAGAAEGGLDASNILKPALARGEIQVIGATTLDEYRKHIEQDAALERRFQPVMVGEPSVELAIEMLLRLRGRYEAHHGVRITEGAIVAAARYGDRYITNRFLPDKAIDLIDEAGSRVRMSKTGSVRSTVQVREYRRDLIPLRKGVQSLLEQQAFEAASDLQAQQSALEAELNSALLESGRGGFSIPLVTAEDVAEIVASWTGIPVAAIAANEMERLLHLESDLHARVIGQEHAVSAVARAIRRSRAGTRNPNRPVASFIFSGPTGVGKTELVKALAATVFGDEEAIIRFDMSEFMERHAVSRLIGAPPGYLGFDEGGQLTEAVRRRPYAVVLFDEVEKAHPDVFNLLLQVLDEGQLTDSQGRIVDFRNTMIVMTTNIGSRVIQKRAAGGIGFGFSDGSDEEANNLRIQRAVHEELGHHFRPEFLNRVDEILVFRQLTEDQIRQVADILVREVGGWLQDKGILLSVTDAFINHAVKLGFDPTYGARPLRRAITTLLEDSLAEAILRGEVSEGDSVRVDWDVRENRITISVPTRTPVLSRQLALA